LKKKVLITGASGFIGKNLINSLLKDKSFEIYGLIKKRSKKTLRKKNFKYIYTDLTKNNEKIKIDFDYIINLAGNIDHKNKFETFKAHYQGVKNLIKILNLKKIKLFIQIGSCLEYGIKKSPHKESFNCSPISHYGKAKLLSTKYIQKKLKNYIILRPYQIYGPYQKKDRLVPIVIDGCLRNKEIPCSDGLQFRDFLFIDDFVELIKKILKKNNNINGIYNVGFGKPNKVKDIINLIQKKIKKGKPIFGRIPMRNEEMKFTYPNISKIKKNYNWRPKIKINVGLKKTINFYAK
tara:strand:+ start:211 stop:1089 length:879 start_codon:yes stop_codon:yes gene_type:complete